jgi:hypothetical protein
MNSDHSLWALHRGRVCHREDTQSIDRRDTCRTSVGLIFYLFLNLFALVRELIMLGPGSNAWLLVATATVTFLILFAAAFAPV